MHPMQLSIGHVGVIKRAINERCGAALKGVFKTHGNSKIRENGGMEEMVGENQNHVRVLSGVKYYRRTYCREKTKI